MPVEIRELVIRTTVTGGEQATDSPFRPSTSGGAAGSAMMDREKLVAECVEQVMEILREQKER